MWLNKHKWCSLTEPSQTVWWRFLSLSEVLPSTGLSSPCFGLSKTRACLQPASKKDTKQIGLKKVLLHMTLFPRLSIFSTRIWSTTRKTQTTRNSYSLWFDPQAKTGSSKGQNTKAQAEQRGKGGLLWWGPDVYFDETEQQLYRWMAQQGRACPSGQHASAFPAEKTEFWGAKFTYFTEKTERGSLWHHPQPHTIQPWGLSPDGLTVFHTFAKQLTIYVITGRVKEEPPCGSSGEPTTWVLPT